MENKKLVGRSSIIQARRFLEYLPEHFLSIHFNILFIYFFVQEGIFLLEVEDTFAED